MKIIDSINLVITNDIIFLTIAILLIIAIYEYSIIKDLKKELKNLKNGKS